MADLRRILSSLGRRDEVERLIKDSPSPSLARTNLVRLAESGGLKSFKKIPWRQFPPLLQLLGGSAYLSDILIRAGEGWPDLFLQQIKTAQKTASDHLAELSSQMNAAMPAERLGQLLRQHKQRAVFPISAPDLSPPRPGHEHE